MDWITLNSQIIMQGMLIFTLAISLLINFLQGEKISTIEAEIDMLYNDFQEFHDKATVHMAGIINMNETPEKTPGMP